MRIYVPATWEMLTQLRDDEKILPTGGTAFALTPTLREVVTGDDDELSELAIREAARASLRLIGAGDDRDDAPARRVVIAADADVTVRPDLDDAVVKLAGGLTLSQVAAFMVDGSDAQDAVRRAAAVIDEADLGVEDAELAVGDAEDFDLGWYATQELPFLLELL